MLDDEEEELEEFYPPAVVLHDEGVIIFDPTAFEEDFNCYAALLRGGELFVLDKDSKDWVNVSPAKKRPNLKPVN